jgi:hypothetical protein
MKHANQMKIKVHHQITAIAIALILGFCVPANAADVLGVNFSEEIKDEGVDMELKGTGIKSVVFIKAFVAGFYADENNDPTDLGEFAKRVDVQYFVSIPGKKLNAFTIDSMKDNITDSEFENIMEKVAIMRDYFVDLKPGDRFSLTYIPGVGTKFAHNNELVGVIEGKEFAKAIFSVWVGERPFDKKLRDQILGSIKIVKKEKQA